MRSRLKTGPARPAFAAAALAAVLVAAGCGSSGNSGAASPSPSATTTSPATPATSASPSGSASAAPAVTNGRIDDVAVTGDRNKVPALKFTAPFGVAATAVKTLAPGTGPMVAKGQLTTVNYTGVNARTGKTFDSSVDPQFKHVGQADFQLTDGRLVAGFITGIVGQKVGSRVLIAIPPKDGYGPGGNTAAGITGTDTLLFVIDINGAKTPLTRAQGATVAPVRTFPTVTVTDGIPTAVAKGPGAAPKAPITEVLVRGTGPKIARGQTVNLQAVASVWRTGKVVTDTWKSGGAQSIAVGTGQLIRAADAALVGQTVGSRVVVVATPPLGVKATADVTTSDSIVFVFDLLAAT